jgi:BMFP domain-containing protein YqiC
MTRISLTQLASLSEDVLEKASQNPTAARLVQSATQARDRLDDLTKRVRGLEAMEKRIAELEERVVKLETKKPPAARKAAPSPPPSPSSD